MVLETDRLTLREYVTEDFDALFEIVSDIETMQHYPAIIFIKNIGEKALLKKLLEQYEIGYFLIRNTI